MVKLGKEVRAWAILWRSETRLDGYQHHLVGTTDHPSRTILFETRAATRTYIAEEYGYIKGRADLRAEPHGWKMPMPILVTVRVEPA